MKVIRVTAAALLFAAVAFAHTGGRDILGTIVKFDRQSIVVKRTDGHQESVGLTATTTYRAGTSAATWSSMHVGSRVVVHADHAGKAIEVHLPKQN